MMVYFSYIGEHMSHLQTHIYIISYVTLFWQKMNCFKIHTDDNQHQIAISNKIKEVVIMVDILFNCV